MIRAGVLPNPTEVPPACTVGPDGEWIYDTDLEHVEAAADHYGRPVVTAGGYHACVRVLPNEQVLILRAPAQDAS